MCRLREISNKYKRREHKNTNYQNMWFEAKDIDNSLKVIY